MISRAQGQRRRGHRPRAVTAAPREVCATQSAEVHVARPAPRTRAASLPALHLHRALRRTCPSAEPHVALVYRCVLVLRSALSLSPLLLCAAASARRIAFPSPRRRSPSASLELHRS